MALIYLLVVTPLAALLTGFYVGGLETLIQIWDEWSDRRNRRRELLREYDYWYSKAQGCGEFGVAAEQKGKAVACMAVVQNELRRLDGRKK